MTTMMNHHDARGPEETMQNLSPVVPAGFASRSSTTGLSRAGMSDGPPAKDTGELAQPERRLCHRLEDRPARDAGTPAAGAAAIAGATGPTTVGVRERPVRRATR